jgi:G patch domain-containing protein 1
VVRVPTTKSAYHYIPMYDALLTKPISPSAITLALERSLLPAPKDSVGARILKKMGWRIGQGIGPRITWRQREMAFGRDPDAPSDDIDEEAKKHVYAPRDTPLIIVERKDNFHGLGYDPGLGLHASLGVAPDASKQSSGPRLAGTYFRCCFCVRSFDSDPWRQVVSASAR